MGSRVVQARLHPDNAREQIALSVLDQWKKGGHPARETITNALCLLEGEPIPMRDDIKAIRAMLEELRTALVDTIATLIDDKLDDLAVMEPTERREYMHEEVARRSSFGSSILNAVNVANYEDDND